MVNGKPNFHSPFTIYHSRFTSLLAVVALAGGERAPLIAFAERAGRAAAADGTLVGAVARPAVVREHALDLAVRARDDVDADQLADAAGGGRARVRRGLDGAHVAADEDRHVAGADVLLADELYVGR